ncbi:MAG: RNA polymerase factor sigma-54 [Treponema sp.]|nr:RNA polymerase factor sigma-54 [Treponema sp.]
MNPQVYLSIKIMELPLVDLREKIDEELGRNPALEILNDPSADSYNEPEPPPTDIEEYFETSSDSGFIRSGQSGREASDNHHQFIEGVLTRPETLQQHLLWQLQLEPIDDAFRAVATTLIQNLDDNGFHKEQPEMLFNEGEIPSCLPQAIQLVQSLDPVGCCTSDFRESLTVQIKLLYDVPHYMECSLDCLELFEKGKFSMAAKKMNCKTEDARSCYSLIKKLSPFPGRRFATTEIRFVIPDIQVVRIDGSLSVVINNEVLPSLGINPFFKKIDSKKQKKGKDASYNRPVQQFVRQNVKEARFFIHSISMRKQTLKMVASAILEFQRPFFDSGPQHLVPLTLSDIAEELGIHETTVSRAANGKYMQTEWGIFEMRYFFTNSISGTGSGGSNFSKGGVKAIITELVKEDNQSLSDQDIVGLLEQRGISIARRTVAKYRKELDLGSSYSRKRE